MTAYSDSKDLLVGDMTVGSIDTEQYVSAAADEINAEIGMVYVLPLTPAPAEGSVAALQLKNCNNMLASGRLIMAQATGAEAQGEHAYGRSLVDEAKRIIARIVCGEIELGCTKVPAHTPVAGSGNGPSIGHYDATSGVDAFYENARPSLLCAPYVPWTPGPLR